MVSYEINADKPIYMTNTTFDTIRNIESRNWNRRLSPRNMSIIYELIDVWHRRIDSTIQMLSSNTPTTDNHPDSNGIYQYDIQDNIGTVKYQYIIDEEGNSALFLVHISFNLPWNLGVGRLSIIENKQYNTMKNTRNRVRLTESQLHNVIKESVKQVLSELDWKTYANAGKKAGSFGDISTQREMNPNGNPKQWFNNAVNARGRANKFYDKARDQFNKDYGYSNGSLYDKDASNVRMGGSFTSSEEFSPHAVGYQDKGYGNPYKYEYGRRYDGYHGEDMSPEEFFNGNKDAAESYNNANSEIGDFKKGNYDYEPNGRGWHLKDNMDESIRRAIRNVLR